MKRSLRLGILISLAAFFVISANAQTTTVTFNNPANNGLPGNTFTVPPGVTSVTIGVWGAGGGGASRFGGGSPDGGGGGGGGGYRGGDITVASGNTIAVIVGSGGAGGLSTGLGGSNGNLSSATHTNGTITANGGAGGTSANNGGAGGAGGGGSFAGTVASQVTFTGGTGGDGGNSEGGSGGGGAGNTQNGGAGEDEDTDAGGGTGGNAGGGEGGNGGNDVAGGNGQPAGGGGGGAGDDDNGGTGFAGGTGGNGQVTITYTLPNVTGLTASGATTCFGNGAVITASSSNLVSGTYTVTYNVSGTNTVASTTATMTFTAGTPGTGTFTTAALPNVGAANVVQITRLTNAAGNFTNTTVNTAAFTTTSATAPATPGAITGTTPVCPSTAGLVYSISAVSGATSYTWSVPTGWSITSGQGTISATVTSGTNGQNGNITVTANNTCGSSSPSSLAVTSAACPITYYSRQTGNWHTLSTWSLTSHTVDNVPASLPTALDIVLIGGNDVVSIQANSAAINISTLTVDDGTTGSLIYGTGNNNTGTPLTITGNFLVGPNGSVTVGGNGNAVHTLTLGGATPNSFTNNGSFNLISPNDDVVNTIFTGAAVTTINGSSATSTFNNVTVSGPVTFGDNANARTWVVEDLTVSSTLQSGSTAAMAHTLQVAGDFSNTGTMNLTANSATNHALTFAGTGSILGSAAATTTLYNLNVTNGTRTFGDNANGRTITVVNDFTISNGATFQSGNTGGQLHQIYLAGNFTNNGTLNLMASAPTFQLFSFNGSVAKAITGSGTFGFHTITMEKTGGVNVNITTSSNVSIGANLTFSSNSLLVVGSNSNVVLAPYAAISGAASDRYIQLDGTQGNSNSTLIKTTDNTLAPWDFIFPIGTSVGGYTPADLQTISTAPDANSTLAIKPIITSSLKGRMKRSFQLTVTGNDNGTTFSNGVFSYVDPLDFSTGDVEGDYTTGWRYESGMWTSVASSINTTTNAYTITGGTAASATLNTGTYIYTMGAPISVQRAWYSYQTGDYNDFNTWTLDPSGTTFDNGLTLTPAFGDEINILNGFTVTVNVSTQSLASTRIEGGGILDLPVTTTNIDLGVITGTGLLKINGTGLPTGNYTDFVSINGGTIEYYDVGGNLPTTQTTYNNLRMTNSTGSNIVYTLVSDMVVNGTFVLTTTGAGTVTWQINDASNQQRTITLNKDLTVASGGRITAGTGNSGSTTPHALTMFGNIVNNGIIRFFDPTSAPFTSSNTSLAVLCPANYQGNGVNVTFSGTTNQTVTCNNTTDFYRFIVNKGTGQQATLTVNSSAANNMRLYGPVNRGSTGSGTTDFSNGSLSLINGTLQLTGTLTIPSILESYGTSGGALDAFTLPQNASLWLNSPGISLTITTNINGNNNDQRFTINGLLRISNGSQFVGGHSRGINSASGGGLIVEGANTVLTIWQFRPILGGSNIFTYLQTGGTVNVGTKGHNGTPVQTGVDDGTNNDATDRYARFSLGHPNSAFQMSGGIINIGSPTTPTGGTSLAVGIDVQSGSGNFSVTGGTINAYIPQLSATPSPGSGSQNFTIYSTAPFGNLNIYREGAGGPLTQAAILRSPLTILGNLTLVDNASLSGNNITTLLCNNNALTIGGNLIVPANTAFYTGTSTGTTSGAHPNQATGITTPITTPAGTSTITFNGSGAQTWTHASAAGTVLTSNNVIINKSAGTLSVTAGTTLPTIGTLTLTSGTFNDGGNTITVNGLTNNAVHTSTGTGSITYSGATGTTINGNNGTFGNLFITTAGTNTINLAGNQTVTGTLRLVNNTSLNIASHSLTALGAIYSDANPGTGVAFSNTKRILTSGFTQCGRINKTRQHLALSYSLWVLVHCIRQPL